jgi:hypothetical protein
VDGGERAVVAGVEGGEQVQRLDAPHLADHDPVGPHPQGIAQQVADRHLAPALDSRRPALEANDVGLLQPQLGRVLDRHHPLLRRDEAGEGVQQRRLARAGATADEDAAAVRDRLLEQVSLL